MNVDAINLKILEILTTAICYLIVPLAISIFYKYQITRNTMQLIIGINGMAVFILMLILFNYFYVSPDITFALVMGYIDYFISLHITKYKPLKEAVVSQDTEQNSSTYVTPNKTTDSYGVSPKRFLVLFILLCISVSANIYFSLRKYHFDTLENSLSYAKDEADKYKKQYEEANNSLSELTHKYDGQKQELEYMKASYDTLDDSYMDLMDECYFYEEGACVVSAVEGKKYHRYSCQYVDDFTEYYIFNVEYAESLGYTPCSVCEPPTPQ